MTIPSATASQATIDDPIARVLALYENGQCLDAWEAGRALGPLEEWPGVRGRLLAGRLATHLGAPRLGSLLHLRCYRANRAHPEAQYYYIFDVVHRRGALAAWRERTRHGEPTDGDWYHLAEYHGQCSQLLGALRDFETAEEHLRKAFVPDGRRLYWFTERATLFELQDRFEDALAAAREGLALNPRYPPSITTTAHVLELLGRADEALDLLARGSGETQSSSIPAALVRLLIRLHRMDEIPDAIARYEATTPLRERQSQDWLDSTRAELATRAGDYATAMALVERVEHPYYRDIAANLRTFLEDPARPAPRRVELPVPFIRQHYLTCAPATLTAISRFWEQPAEHLAVAEEICYDGTPDYSERRWARENGWKAVELRVDWPSAKALIDRGIPFTLTLSDVASGHLQAVIGYDEPTGVLLVRDSMVHDTLELNARAFLAQQASTGPRGMAMVPAEQAHLLDGLELPDAPVYDLYHELQLALESHDRARALAVHERMTEAAPGHRLTLTARRAIAAYDGNPHDGLAAVDALLALYPGDQRLQLVRIGILREIATRDERLAWMQAASEAPGADALLWLEYAAELMADERRLDEASWFVRRALRRRPDDPAAIARLAAVEWQLGRREDAAELHRFAACLAPAREDLAHSCFVACRLLKRPEEGLRFLHRRWEAAASRDAGPTMTLFRALEMLDRADDAFALLDAAIERRPDDGALRMFVGTSHARIGRHDVARRHFEAAKGRVKHSTWMAEMARLAVVAGDRATALATWREILASEPLNLEAHDAVALLLAEAGDLDAAVAHLREACERFPHHSGLQYLLYRWTEGQPAADREPCLRRLIAIDPANAWARRELALNLLQQSRHDEALEAADEGLALDTGHPSGHGVRAHVLHAIGRYPEAAEAYRAAIARSADTSDAILGLLDTCGDSVAECTAALAYVRTEMERQPLFGEGVLAFRAAARGVLTPDELLDELRRLHEHRPELWHAWVALARHLTEMGRTDEALAIVREATERFPLGAPVWLARAAVHHVRFEADEEIAALERCRELDGNLIEPVLRLADALEHAGRRDEVDALLDGAIARMPLATDLRVRHAAALVRRGEAARALELVREALRVSPDSDSAWQALAQWSEEQGDSEGALAFARAHAEARPRELRGWLRLADLALRANRLEEALAAAERVIEMNPQHAIAHDYRALALTSMRRFREAAEACDPPALRGRPSVLLRGRRAWVDVQRGDVRAAIAEMERIVADNPDYLWGWTQLVEWHAFVGQLQEAVQAARRWAWLEPSNVVPLGWLGDVLRRLGDTAGAKEVFERAMRLEPSYLFAGFSLFALLMEEGDLAGALRTLEIMAPYAGPEQITASRVEVAAARGDRDSALEMIRSLCLDPAHEGPALKRAVDAITKVQWLVPLEHVLRDVLRGATWNPATPELWAMVRARRGRMPNALQYRWLASLGEPGKHAINHLLAVIGDRVRRNPRAVSLHDPSAGWQLLLIRWACRDWRDDDVYWGNVGYVQATRMRSRAVIRWMRDWRSRQGVEPWMLQNLTLALLDVHRDRDALEVLRHVSHRFAHRDVGPALKLWCAIGAALDGDFATAERHLHETPPESLERRDVATREAAAMLVRVLQGPRERSAFAARDRALIEGAELTADREPAITRLLALSRMRIGKHVRDPLVVLGAWRRLHATGVDLAIGVTLGIALLRLLAM